MSAPHRLRATLTLAVGLVVSHPPVATVLSGAGGAAYPWVGYLLVLGTWAAYIAWVARGVRGSQGERP